jgi:hypothetical protein
MKRINMPKVFRIKTSRHPTMKIPSPRVLEVDGNMGFCWNASLMVFELLINQSVECTGVGKKKRNNE